MFIDIFGLICYEISLRQEKNAYIQLKYNISNIDMSNNGTYDMLKSFISPSHDLSDVYFTHNILNPQMSLTFQDNED